METTDHKISLSQRLIDHFEKHSAELSENESERMIGLRKDAIDHFKQVQFPKGKEEKWRNTEISWIEKEDFRLPYLNSYKFKGDVQDLLRCEIHDFETTMLTIVNGWFVNEEPLHVFDNGVIMGSVLEARKQFPELVEKYYGKVADYKLDGFTAINTALSRDGIFIYVPKNVVIEKPVQMVSLITEEANLFVQNRNLVVLEANSKLTLVQCDDSNNHDTSFANSLTEIFVEDNANLERYKLQNLNDNSVLINSSFIRQSRDSNLATTAVTYNGGIIRNNIVVNLEGENSFADVRGLYLMDKEQHVDNQVYINHAVPNCNSNELFKGILDDEASAVFNGYVYVAKDAQKTNAFQNNRNILLKPTAHIDTMPFLEIYADDVKCSHGATVGQLDTEAMFYLRQRGINFENARMLLMYAFAAEVIKDINIDALRERIDDMVKKRLRGELSICDKCVLHCGSPEQTLNIEIDPSKI
ncbi:MAG: Fe-S cluster assembly protein SufD [Hyphomicrobiales bacterium]